MGLSRDGQGIAGAFRDDQGITGFSSYGQGMARASRDDERMKGVSSPAI